MKTSMKKVLIALLSLILVVGMSSTAFAYTALDDDGDYSTQNEDSMHIIYSNMGMLRVMDEGTSATVSEDGTKVEVTATTSSSTNWGKTTKLAFVEQTASAEEKDAAPAVEFENSEYSSTAVSRVMHFSIPVQEVGMRIPVCRYNSNEEGTGAWTDFSKQAYYTVLCTNDMYNQLTEAYANATDETVKANIETALGRANYNLTNKCGKMFKPESAAVVKAGSDNILKLTLGSTTLTEVFVGFASEASDDSAIAIDVTSGQKGYVDIPIAEFDTPIVLAFKGSSWTNRTVIVSRENKTVTFLKTFEDATIGEVDDQTFTGKAIEPEITVEHKSGSTVTTLVENQDYSLEYVNNVNAGTAEISVSGMGDYAGTQTATFTINKADNPLTVSAKTVKIKKKAVKKKAKKLAAAKVMTVSNAQGTVSYKGVGINKKSKKALKINAKNGQITVKKKTKKGTYKMKVTVTAAGNNNYNATSATKTVVIKVK